MFARATKHDEDLCPKVANTVSLHIDLCNPTTSSLKHLLIANLSFLGGVKELFVGPNKLDHLSCIFLSQSIPFLPCLHALSWTWNHCQLPFEEGTLPSFTISAPNGACERKQTVIPINSSANASSKVVVSPSKIQRLPSSASKVCSLPPSPCTELIIPLQSHNKLKSLTLQGPLDEPRIGVEECASLAQWLSSLSCSLKELELGNNDLTLM